MTNKSPAPIDSAKVEDTGEPVAPAYALRGLYKLACKYFIDGKPCAPDEYIAWQSGLIEAITKAKLPDPKYYGGSAEEGSQHEVKCAYVDGWNDCRGSILAAPTPSTQAVGEPTGWKLVPIEPTHEMLVAAAQAEYDGDWQCKQENRYQAMLAAAPALPVPVACPECGGSGWTWKCTCTPMWTGFALSTAPTTGSAPWQVGDDTSSVQISRDGSTHKWGCKCDGCVPSAGSVPAVVSGPCLIVKGSGETDLPIVHIVHSLEEARHAVLSLMYSNPDDAEDAEELFAEFDDTMADDNYWTIAFEIGGISVERVCIAAAPTPFPVASIGHIQELMLKWINVNAGPNATVVWNEIEAALHSLAAAAHMDGYAAGVKDLQEFSTLINREKS